MDIKLIGGSSEYLLITQKVENGMNYKVISFSSGTTLFDYTNKLGTYSEISEDNIFCMGLLFSKK